MKPKRNGRVTARKPKLERVCLGIPHRGVDDVFFDAYTNLLMHERDRIVAVASVSGSLTADARNRITRRFVDSDAEWMLQIDADMDFSPDVLRALLAHADAKDRPVVGALCFKVSAGGEVEPAMARGFAEPFPHLEVVRDWTDGALVQVDACGGACLLVHRSVIEALPEPWFGTGELAGVELGEDYAFCLSARQAGFPVFVASSVDIGHVKPRVYGLDDWRRQDAERRGIGTFVVIPVRNAGDPVPVAELSEHVAGIIAIPNDGPVNIPAKWNQGLAWAEQEARAEGRERWNVLFLNDDCAIDVADVVPKLSRALRQSAENAVAYPNVHFGDGRGVVETHSDTYAGQTLAGFCFMVRGEAAYAFDESMPWWYSDADLERRVRADGYKVVCVLDAVVDHKRPMESTRGALLDQARRDEATFARKWGLDPSTLWLASHPEFGAEVPA